jgi:hypothetical protein
MDFCLIKVPDSHRRPVALPIHCLHEKAELLLQPAWTQLADKI